MLGKKKGVRVYIIIHYAGLALVPRCQAMARGKVARAWYSAVFFSLSNFNASFIDGVALLRPKMLLGLFRAGGEVQSVGLATALSVLLERDTDVVFSL
jgi:hypothetical protein